MAGCFRAQGAVALLALAGSLFAQPLTSERAAELDAQGRCDESERYYATALAGPSASQALLNNAGNHYLVCGQPEKSQALFEQLLRRNPTHVNANLQLARLAAERREGSKALEYLSHINEGGIDVLLLRAESLHWAGQRTAAAKILDGIDATAREDARVAFLAGLTCARMELYSRAETAFSAALARQPGDFEILFNLGRVAARAKHYDRAQRALESAAKIRPDDANVLVELGRLSAAREDYRRAVFYLAQARRKAPANPGIILVLARAAEDAGFYEDASAAYDEYVLRRPGDDAARRDRAKACGFTEARRESARKELNWYLDKHPDDPLGHYIYAQVFWQSEPQEALRHLTEAVRLNPDSASFRFSRGWMLQRLGQMAESLPDLEAAGRLAPENGRVPDLIGLARLSLDQPAEAERSFRQALARNPGDPETILHLGRALMALGREEEAQPHMDKYRAIRTQGLPGLRAQFGMIELATLSAPEQRRREIERFRAEAAAHPDRPSYQFRLASLLLADNRKQESLQEFGRLLELNADTPLLEEAGSVLMLTREYALARKFLERAVRERPSARLNLAVAILQTSGAEPALAFLDAISERERTGDDWLLTAGILETAGRRADAEKALSIALEMLPAAPAAVQRAAALLLRMDRKEDALKLLDRAIAANPRDTDMPLTRAVILGIAGQPAAAEAALKDIERRWPELDRAYLAHGLLLENTGRRADAKRMLKTAAALGSSDPAARCALARLEAAPQPAAECSCFAGLEQMIAPGCGKLN